MSLHKTTLCGVVNISVMRKITEQRVFARSLVAELIRGNNPDLSIDDCKSMIQEPTQEEILELIKSPGLCYFLVVDSRELMRLESISLKEESRIVGYEFMKNGQSSYYLSNSKVFLGFI